MPALKEAAKPANKDLEVVFRAERLLAELFADHLHAEQQIGLKCRELGHAVGVVTVVDVWAPAWYDRGGKHGRRRGNFAHDAPDKGISPMRDRISVRPEIHFGKPCVSGTRIPVQSVLELVREGLTFADITRDYYPDLSPLDIRACIQYAIDVVAAEEIHLSTAP